MKCIDAERLKEDLKEYFKYNSDSFYKETQEDLLKLIDDQPPVQEDPNYIKISEKTSKTS